MPPVLQALAMLSGLLALGACTASGTSATVPTSASAAAGYEAEVALCATLTNSYRTSAGRPALTRDERLETYAAEAARYDGSARTPHQYVVATNFGNGLVRAENELIAWPLSTYGTVRKVVETGLAQMWREGPTGDHYRNMAGDYTGVGCGVFVSNGEVSVSQAFR